MISKLVAATALVLLLASSVVASAQDLSSQLVGVWKRTSTVNKVVATGETSKPAGENPTGSLILTRGGYFTWIFIDEGRKVPGEAAADRCRAHLSVQDGRLRQRYLQGQRRQDDLS